MVLAHLLGSFQQPKGYTLALQWLYRLFIAHAGISVTSAAEAAARAHITKPEVRLFLEFQDVGRGHGTGLCQDLRIWRIQRTLNCSGIDVLNVNVIICPAQAFKAVPYLQADYVQTPYVAAWCMQSISCLENEACQGVDTDCYGNPSLKCPNALNVPWCTRPLACPQFPDEQD